MKIKVPSKELNVVSSKNTDIEGDIICADFVDLNDCELHFPLDFEESSNSYVKLVPVKTGSAKLIPLK